MVLEIPGKILGQDDVRETPSATSSSSSSSTIIAPIGTILPWLKSYTNTPQALPTGWVECDGSVISDADSVYDGQTLPDLNGGEFVRGAATSGGTGGAATNTANLHETSVVGSQAEAHPVGILAGGATSLVATSAGGANLSARSATTDAFSILPPYYNVVWIMRIK